MMVEGFGDARIEIKFDVPQPVELVQLALALQGIARDYRRFMNEQSRGDGRKYADEDVRLYVTRVESGSILAELASAVPVIGSFMPLIDTSKTFSDYVQAFGATIEYFRGLASRALTKPEQLDTNKAVANTVADIMGVVAQQPVGALVVRAGAKKADGEEWWTEVSYTREQALEAQRGALIASKLLDYRGDADYRNVLLYFQRTSTDAPRSEGRTNDKAIIGSISQKALPVYFASELDAARVRDMKADPSQNPFKSAFRVDVNVESDRNGVPRFYRVLHIHEVIADAGTEDDAE